MIRSIRLVLLLVAPIYCLAMTTDIAYAQEEQAKQNAAHYYADAANMIGEDIRKRIDALHRMYLAYPVNDDGIPDEYHCVLSHGGRRPLPELRQLRSFFDDIDNDLLHKALGMFMQGATISQCDFGHTPLTSQDIIHSTLEPIYRGPIFLASLYGLLAAEDGDIDTAVDMALTLLKAAAHFAKQPQVINTDIALVATWHAEQIICRIALSTEMQIEQRQSIAQALRLLVAPEDMDVFYIQTKLKQESKQLAEWVLDNPDGAEDLMSRLVFSPSEVDTPEREEWLAQRLDDLAKTPEAQSLSLREAYAHIARAWGQPDARSVLEWDLLAYPEPGRSLAALYAGLIGVNNTLYVSQDVISEGVALLWALEYWPDQH